MTAEVLSEQSLAPFIQLIPSVKRSRFWRPIGLSRLPEPLTRPRVAFYPKARNAIWHALNALRLSPEQNILMPAYHCGSDLDAVLKSGTQVKFYRIDRTAQIDVEHLRQTIDKRTKALFLIHYFGFPQRDLPALLQLCRDHGLYLIEDCAHSLYSTLSDGRMLGTFGDLAVFSLWKTLPLPEGGATLINNQALIVKQPNRSRPLYDRVRDARYRVANLMVGRYGAIGKGVQQVAIDPLAAAVKRIAGRHSSVQAGNGGSANRQQINPHVTFDVNTADLRMSSWAGYLLGHFDHQRIRETRRRNYEFLSAAFSGIPNLRPLFPSLYDGVCPLCFPVVVEEAASLQDYLRSRKIITQRFWDEFHGCSPTDGFPDAAFLNAHIVAFPIHQDLTVAALQRMAEATLQYASQ